MLLFAVFTGQIEDEVLKQTLTEEEIADMSEVKLHETHGSAVAGGIASFKNRVKLLTEIKKRFNNGKIGWRVYYLQGVLPTSSAGHFAWALEAALNRTTSTFRR